MDKLKCFSRYTLIGANKMAEERGYNRVLDSTFVEKLPEDTWFPIVQVWPHNHAAGKEVPMHYRCWVVFNAEGDTGWIDVDIDVYNALPEISPVSQEKAS